MSANIMAPPAVSDIRSCSCEIRLEAERVPADDRVTGEADGVTVATGAGLAG